MSLLAGIIGFLVKFSLWDKLASSTWDTTAGGSEFQNSGIFVQRSIVTKQACACYISLHLLIQLVYLSLSLLHFLFLAYSDVSWCLWPAGKTVITSDHALKLEFVPDWIAIVGSGYIGLEFSDVYTALGSEVMLTSSFHFPFRSSTLCD